METLKSGISARWDTFSGLIPVRVLSVTRLELSTRVTFRVTRTRGPYKTGEILESSSLRIAPVKSVRRRRYSTTIRPYHIQHDQESAP